MIQYSLPDFTSRLSFNLLFSQMMHSAPELFFEDVEIGSMYGNFPGCIMNGGRVQLGAHYSYDQIAKTFDQIEEAGISIRLTFTNVLLKPEHYDDEYSNLILKAASGRNAMVIVNLDELGDYISSKYHLKLILSTTRALNGVEELNKMLNRYDMVVLDYNHNKEEEYLRKVNDPTRLEVMPNQLCRPGCKDCQDHYEHDSKIQLGLMSPCPFKCKGGCETYGFMSRIQSSPTLLGNDDVRRLNTIYGIHDFKLVGRLSLIRANLESCLYYLVRPENYGIVNKIVAKKMQFVK